MPQDHVPFKLEVFVTNGRTQIAVHGPSFTPPIDLQTATDMAGCVDYAVRLALRKNGYTAEEDPTDPDLHAAGETTPN